jgi:hypothetical protein
MLFKIGCSDSNSESDSEDNRTDFLKPENMKQAASQSGVAVQK